MHPIVLLIAIAIFLAWLGLTKIIGIILTSAAIFGLFSFIKKQSTHAAIIKQSEPTNPRRLENTAGDVRFDVVVKQSPPSVGQYRSSFTGGNRKTSPSRALQSPEIQTEVSPGTPISGLIIRREPLERILSGEKTWEMRSRNTSKRETVALIEKGGKRILGVATISEVHGPLGLSTLLRTVEYHGISEERLISGEVSNLKFAWVLSNVRQLKEPVSFQPRSGQVIFATLTDEERTRLARQLQ